ncbi:MAG: metal-dependent transcriptional regulator [Lachnospiraceae bacterium]
MDRNQEGVNKTREDYLEAILMIRERQGYVRSVDVAEQLGVAKPSVTYTTKRLKEAGLISADQNGMLLLTAQGNAIAERVYDRHQKLTAFFTALGVSKEQARIDACKVEHDLSEETYEAIIRHVQAHRPDLADTKK